MDRDRSGEIRTVEYHTAGEPFRIVVGGVPELRGATVPEKRQWCQQHLDPVRELLVNEPRGHADMYGGFPTAADDANGDLGVVFFHKDGFSTACGHGTIALVTWAIDERILAAEPSAAVDAVVDVPSGRLRTRAEVDADGRVRSVRFWNVPSYRTGADVEITTSRGPVTADLAFGGAFYATVALDETDLAPDKASLAALIALGREVKAALAGHPGLRHDTDGRLSGLYGVIFHETLTASAPRKERNVTVFADGEVDRSPCGSGTSARLAVLHARGLLGVGETLVNRGIAAGEFVGVVEGVSGNGDRRMVSTSVEGAAFRTGTAVFTADPRDPIGRGFQLR